MGEARQAHALTDYPIRIENFLRNKINLSTTLVKCDFNKIYRRKIGFDIIKESILGQIEKVIMLF